MKKVYNFLAFFLLSISLMAQVGLPDLSFANQGIYQLDLNQSSDSGAEVITQPDGKVLVLFSGNFPQNNYFDFGVVRLNLDGSVDSTFAVDGFFQFENPLASDLSYHIELLDDGKMILAGSYSTENGNSDWLMIKLTSSGNLDPTFGDNGVSIFEVDISEDYIRSIVIADDGKIYAGGFSYKPNFSYRRLVIGRFNADGSIDETYGNNGIFMWKDDDTYNYLASLYLNDDESIYVGATTKPSSSDRPSVFKVLPEGSGLDTSFGTNGLSIAPAEGRCGAMAIHQNGNILLCSPTSIGNDLQLAVIAYNPDGSLNTSFGVDGIFTAGVNPGDHALDMTVQSDGKIVVSGESIKGAFMGSHFITARCDENGIIDSTWGGEGVHIITTFDSGIAWARSIHFDKNNGSVYLAGTASYAGTLNDIVVVRLNNLVDADGDGFYLGIDDCDDSNEDINPDGIEIPNNGIDEDCDGADLISSNTLVEEIEKYRVSPNPATNFVQISRDESTIQPTFVQINSYSGKHFKTINWTEGQQELNLDVQNLPNGLYIIGIHSAEGVIIKKLIKH